MKHDNLLCKTDQCERHLAIWLLDTFGRVKSILSPKVKKFDWAHEKMFQLSEYLACLRCSCLPNFKNGPFPATFSSIFVFSIQLTVNKCSIYKFCRWLDSSHGAVELEVTALPTDPQPLPRCLPKCDNFLTETCQKICSDVYPNDCNAFFFNREDSSCLLLRQTVQDHVK